MTENLNFARMKPALSIVICTYNRQKFIGECLQCLGNQTISANLWEVIVVDNHSNDQTAEIVKNFQNHYPLLPFHYVFENQKGLSYARNRGIAEARAEIITFIDDDAEAVPIFAETILKFMHQHPEAAGCGGSVIPKYSECTEPAWMNKYLNGFVGLVDHGQPARLFEGAMKYPIGCNMTYRKNIMLQAGGFNNQLTFRGDDKHIFYVVSRINPQVYYLPEALVYHNIDAHRLTFDNFRKLFLKTGNEERIRVRSENGWMGLIKKAVEYLVKFGASLLIWLIYSLKGHEIKGRYVMFSQWFTLMGFGRRQVFVR